MSLELIHTSVPQGLKPGSRGFCTVAMTRGVPTTLAEKLESMSGYRFAPDGSGPDASPPSLSHTHLTLGGRVYHVLSRVAPCAADYSGRTNKIAHHFALAASELPSSGPAAVLGTPGTFKDSWQGAPRLIDAEPKVTAGASAPAPCSTWTRLAGDAGWGGELIRLMRLGKHNVYILYPPGQDALRLASESVALLSPSERWQATFSTAFMGELPSEVRCQWRFMQATPEARRMTRAAAGSVVIDLTGPLDLPTPCPEVDAARSGAIVPPIEVAVRSPLRIAKTPEPTRLVGKAPNDASTKPLTDDLIYGLPLDDPSPVFVERRPAKQRTFGRAILVPALCLFAGLVLGVMVTGLYSPRPPVVDQPHPQAKEPLATPTPVASQEPAPNEPTTGGPEGPSAQTLQDPKSSEIKSPDANSVTEITIDGATTRSQVNVPTSGESQLAESNSSNGSTTTPAGTTPPPPAVDLPEVSWKEVRTVLSSDDMPFTDLLDEGRLPTDWSPTGALGYKLDSGPYRAEFQGSELKLYSYNALANKGPLWTSIGIREHSGEYFLVADPVPTDTSSAPELTLFDSHSKPVRVFFLGRRIVNLTLRQEAWEGPGVRGLKSQLSKSVVSDQHGVVWRFESQSGQISASRDLEALNGKHGMARLVIQEDSIRLVLLPPSSVGALDFPTVAELRRQVESIRTRLKSQKATHKTEMDDYYSRVKKRGEDKAGDKPQIDDGIFDTGINEIEPILALLEEAILRQELLPAFKQLYGNEIVLLDSHKCVIMKFILSP